MFQQLYSPVRVCIKGILFPLKISTNKDNIHSTGNFCLHKISLNIFAKELKHLLPPVLNISWGPTCFPDHNSVHFTQHLLTLNSPHWTIYLTSINDITLFLFNIHQLPYALSTFFFDHQHLPWLPHFNLEDN